MLGRHTSGPDSKEVGFLSLARWGIGGTAVVLALAAIGIALLVEWARLHMTQLLILSVPILAAMSIIVAVKTTEEIRPTRYIDDEVLGKHGIVVSDIDGGAAPGVIRVGSQMWSAKAKYRISAGEEVIVVKREGVYLWVARPEDDVR